MAIFLIMDKAIAAVLFCLLTHLVIAQPAHFFADGSRWVYHTYESGEPGQEFFHYSDEQNIIHGDTLIGDQRYYKLYTTYHNTLVVNIFPPLEIESYDSIGPTFLRYDSLQHQVYYLPAVDSTERLIYKFNLGVGDTVPMQSPNFPTTILSIDTVTILGGDTRRYFVGDANQPWVDERNYILEGVGGSNGLTYFQPELFVVSGGIIMTQLVCFQYGDSIYPSNTECPFIDFISSSQQVRDDFVMAVSPNPTKDVISFTISDDLLNAKVTMMDGLGRVVHTLPLTDLVTSVQLPAKGIYFWRLEHGRQFVKTGKVICQ